MLKLIALYLSVIHLQHPTLTWRRVEIILVDGDARQFTYLTDSHSPRPTAVEPFSRGAQSAYKAIVVMHEMLTARLTNKKIFPYAELKCPYRESHLWVK